MLQNDLGFPRGTRHTYPSDLMDKEIADDIPLSRKTVTSIACLCAVLSATAACSPSMPPVRIPQASLKRQIFLEQHDESIVNAPAGNSRAIVPLPDGGVVLA